MIRNRRLKTACNATHRATHRCHTPRCRPFLFYLAKGARFLASEVPLYRGTSLCRWFLFYSPPGSNVRRACTGVPRS